MARKINQSFTHNGITHIQLTQGHWTQIDASDAPEVLKYCWHADPNGQTVYARTCFKRRRRTYKPRLHRFLNGLGRGTKNHLTLEVDHRDGNGLNNRRSNFLLCDHPQNIRNGFRRRASHGQMEQFAEAA